MKVFVGDFRRKKKTFPGLVLIVSDSGNFSISVKITDILKRNIKLHDLEE